MSKRYKEVLFFFTGDAAKFIGVHQSTVYRWLENGELKGEKIRNNTRNYWIISLDEINRKLKMMKLPEISKEEADFYWETGRLPSDKKE